MKGYGGTGSQGKHGRLKVHIPCRRCGRSAYHRTHEVCASCGYGNSSKLRKYAWQTF